MSLRVPKVFIRVHRVFPKIKSYGESGRFLGGVHKFFLRLSLKRSLLTFGAKALVVLVLSIINFFYNKIFTPDTRPSRMGT